MPRLEGKPALPILSTDRGKPGRVAAYTSSHTNPLSQTRKVPTITSVYGLLDGARPICLTRSLRHHPNGAAYVSKIGQMRFIDPT
jgi:hypothetical protein